MKKYSNDKRNVTLIVSGNIALIDFTENGISGNVSFEKHLLDAYAEDYIKEHFEMSEKDGWIRKEKEDGKETSL